MTDIGKFCCLLLALLLGDAAAAVDLFHTEVQVSDQSTAARRLAVRQGLAEVIVRVSGRVSTLNNPEVEQALDDRAERFLLQFSYAPSLAPSPLPEIVEVPTERLLLQFQSTQVIDLLRSAGEPILPNNRPEILAWLAIDDGQRRLLGADTESTEAELAMSQAQRRGIRLLLPLQDLEESLQVNADTVWNYNVEAIDDVSRRYGTDAVLVARLFGTSAGEWIGDWRYQQGDQSLAGDARRDSLEASIAAMVDAVAEAQSQRYAIFSVPGESQALHVIVDEVADFDAYVKISNYLDKLTSVRAATINRVQGKWAEYLVYTDAGIEGLRQEIRLGSALLPVDDATAGILHYRWRGQ